MKKKNQEKLEQLLNKYLEGTATPAEKEIIHQWYDQLESDTPLDITHLAELNKQKEKSWLSLNEKLIHADEPVIYPDQVAEKTTKNIFRLPVFWSSVAAILLLAFGIGFFRETIFNRSAETEISFLEEKNSSLKPLRLSLTDGSTVWLEPGALVRYPAAFSKNRRDILLEGDAFFEVFRDPERPFRVYSKTMVVKVLGTSFTVKGNKKGQEEEVIVRTGKVSVFPQAQPLNTSLTETIRTATETKGVILLPNQRVEVAKSGKSFRRGNVAAKYWLKLVRPSYLVFDNASLAVVINRLSDDYKIDIQLANPKLNYCTLTASLGDQPLETKLEMICKSIGATYQVKDNLILIDGPGCAM